ncbi:hypothetical protein CSUI_008954, partial [Cystoisospora suis]
RRREEKSRENCRTEALIHETEDVLIDQERDACVDPGSPSSSSFSFSHEKHPLSSRQEDRSSSFTTPSTHLLPSMKDPPLSSSFSDRETDPRVRLSQHASVPSRSSTGEEREKAGELEEDKKTKDQEEREGVSEDENEEEEESQACLRSHKTITPTTCSSSHVSEREEEEEETEEDLNRRAHDTPSFPSSSSSTSLSERIHSKASSSQIDSPPSSSSSILLLWRDLLPDHEFPKDERLLLQLREKLRKVLLEVHCIQHKRMKGKEGQARRQETLHTPLHRHLGDKISLQKGSTR